MKAFLPLSLSVQTIRNDENMIYPMNPSVYYKISNNPLIRDILRM